MKQIRLLLAMLMAVAFVPRAWAEESWTNTYVETKNVTVNGVDYQLCHVYTRQAKIVEEVLNGGYHEYPTILTQKYYASVMGINASGEVEIPAFIYDGDTKYEVRYIGVYTEVSHRSENKQYTYEFFGKNTATTTCEYYDISESSCTVNSASATKLTFQGGVTFKGSLNAPSCTSMVFKEYATIASEASLNCAELQSFEFASVFTCNKGNGPSLLCPKLKRMAFRGSTPTFSGGWSDYSSASASNITVYLNESKEVCDYMHQYSTVWNEFVTLSPLPDQTNPTRHISFTIKGGRVKVGDSSTYILEDTNYDVEQFSDFTFQVTKLYGSEYLVKSVKINGEEMLDAMTLTEGATDAWSYYSYTISPVINDVHIAVEGENIYDNAYAICGAGGNCRWSNHSGWGDITPNEYQNTRWLRSSENPPTLIIIPNEGFTLDRLYRNSYDNTYSVTAKEDGTFEYEVVADARVSVVFKELPPTTTWKVSLLNNEAVSTTMIDKRDDKYNYSLTEGENTVLDKPKNTTIRINGTGTPLVQADGVDISSSFEFTSDWSGEMDDDGNAIMEDYYSGIIPAESLEAKNWVIGLRNENQHVWSATLKGEAEGGSFTMSGGNLADELNLSSDNREGVFVDNASSPTIAAGFNLTSTVAVPKGYVFTVKFNDTDLSSYYANASSTESATNFQATFDGSQTDLAALINDGAWTIEFAKSTADIIEFADEAVKAICVANWDTDGDGELSKAEAAAVTTLMKDGNSVFRSKSAITSFDEFRYFTGLTKVEDYAFYGCTRLERIQLSDNITYVGTLAFFNCSKLKSITLPESVTELGAQVFNSCSQLRQFYLPKNVSKINTALFPYCKNLVSIVVDENNATFDSRGNCNGIVSKYNYLVSGCPTTVLPDDLKGLSSNAFQAVAIKRIDVPASVTDLGYWGLYLTDQLEELVMHQEDPFKFNSICFRSESNYPKNLKLIIPAGTTEAYKAKGWKTLDEGGAFAEIVEAKPEGNVGDVNGDGTISIADVTKLVNMILGKE